jgi:hypothetical protein
MRQLLLLCFLVLFTISYASDNKTNLQTVIEKHNLQDYKQHKINNQLFVFFENDGQQVKNELRFGKCYLVMFEKRNTYYLYQNKSLAINKIRKIVSVKFKSYIEYSLINGKILANEKNDGWLIPYK